jgi:archaellum component FlaF (FlaF/FlaG flagellin family)
MQNDMLPMPVKKQSKMLPIILILALISSLIFSSWSFMAMLDYKNNSDKKSDDAVAKALSDQKTKLDAEYAEKEKSPNETYVADTDFGSMTYVYPKNWELYVDAKGTGSSATIDGYANPGYVPSTSGDQPFALRFQVSNRDYASELKSFDQSIKTSTIKVTPFRLDKVNGQLGSRVEGQITAKYKGVIYLFPLRGKTIKIWTESTQFTTDLDNVIKNFTYSP